MTSDGAFMEEEVTGAAATTTTTLDPYHSIAYQDALDDVHTRFILNLPNEELETADRIFFQLEQAWWFYEDLLCDPRPDLDLPRFSSFRPFARELFDFSSRLPDADSAFNDMWQQYIQYKRKISNYGCILLSADCCNMVLCQVYNGKSYTLPAGKINQGEDGAAAAARETYEETGFDPSCRAGLTAEWKAAAAAADAADPNTNTNKITWNTLFLEQDLLSYQEDYGGKKVRHCYVIVGVPTDYPFSPVCRKEIATVEWFPLDDLPSNTFGVLPFLKPLRQWIRRKQQPQQPQQQQQQPKNSRKKEKSRGKKVSASSSTPTPPTDASSSTSQRQESRGRTSRGRNNNSSRGRVAQQDNRSSENNTNDLIATGLARPGDASGWSEADMFSTNERILNRKVEYDGNPHIFAEQGLQQVDPHAFRIVGGSFLNSTVGSDSTDNVRGQLAPPPDQSRLQPIFQREANASTDTASTVVEGLTPFFTEDGVTPWGEVIVEAKRNRTAHEQQQQAVQTKKKSSRRPREIEPVLTGDKSSNINYNNVAVECFLPTDAQITAKSQAEKSALQSTTTAELPTDHETDAIRQWVANLPKSQPTKQMGSFRFDMGAIDTQVQIAQANQGNAQSIQQWVDNLPKPKPTKLYGVFRLDAEAIMATTGPDMSRQ